MARTNRQTIESEYYPRRARWYSRILSPWFSLRRELRLDSIRLPAGLSIFQFLLSLLLPSFAFFACRRRTLGRGCVAVYLGGALLFIVALGYSVGGLGYGLLISAHATGIIFLEGLWLREHCRFSFRLLLAAATLAAVWLMIYAPAIGFVERNVLVPLNIHGHVVVCWRPASIQTIKRGDWVIYSMDDAEGGDPHGQGGAVRILAGYNWGRVLARAGDHVEFGTGSFSVNGVASPLAPHLPTDGELIVPENKWFVWPELGITGHGHTAETTISAAIMRIAMVSPGQLVGKPFKHWFFRRQILS